MIRRLRAIEKVLRAHLNRGEDYNTAMRRLRLECDAWTQAFIRGEARPMPTGADETILRGGAIIEARETGVIGAGEYLPGTTPTDQAHADRVRDLFAALGDAIAINGADEPLRSDGRCIPFDEIEAELRRNPDAGTLLDRIDRLTARYSGAG